MVVSLCFPRGSSTTCAGEDLVDGALSRLLSEGACCSMKHHGFWGCMDTYKEHQLLQEMFDKGESPWTVWDKNETFGRQDAPVVPAAARPQAPR